MKWGITRKNESPLTFNTFRKDLDNFFDEFFSVRPTTFFETDWLPKIDVQEDENEIHVTAEMPGVEEKDLTVTLENGILTIAGEKKEEKEDKTKSRVVSERRYGSFSRSISLPEGIKQDEIKASFKNGVLKIDIEKTEAEKPKKINVEVH